MSVTSSLLLLLVSIAPALAHAHAGPEAGAPPRLLASAPELVAKFGEPRGPEGLGLRDLQAEIDRLNGLWDDARGREQLLIAEVGDARLAALPAGSAGVAGQPLSEGAIVRRLVATNGVQRAVDLKLGDSVALDRVREELGVVHGLGDQLVGRWFGGAGGLVAGDPPPPTPIGHRCECVVSTSSTPPTGTPPACLKAWGFNYSVGSGYCSNGICPGPVHCTGTIAVFVTLEEPCDGEFALEFDYPPGEITWTPGSGMNWTGVVNLPCGHQFTATLSAGGQSMGTLTLRCKNCPMAPGSGGG